MNHEAIPTGEEVERVKSKLMWSADPPELVNTEDDRKASDDTLIVGDAHLVATPEQVEVARDEMDADIFEQLKGAREKIRDLTDKNAELNTEVNRLRVALQSLQGQIANIIDPDNNN